MHGSAAGRAAGRQPLHSVSAAETLPCPHARPQWLAGSEAPRFAEVGPYTFKAWELRYNLSFNQRWSQARRGAAPQHRTCS